MEKRVLAILLAVTMLCALLYGCSGGTGAAQTQTTAAGSGAATTAAKTTAAAPKTTAAATTTAAPAKSEAVSNFNETGYPIVKEKVTLTSMISQLPQHGEFNEMAYFKKMEEATNVHMDFLAVPSSDWETKKNLTLASGDLPHWFYSGLSANDLQKYGVEGGVLVDIAQYIEKYMPNLTKTFGSYPMAEKVISMANGSVYCMPYIADDATCAGDTLYIRMDLLKKAGVEKKPSTIDEFYDMLVAFKNANFSEDFAPLLPTGGMGAVEGFLFPAFGDGWDPAFADNGDGKVVYNLISEQYHRYLEFVSKLYAEKLLENEVYTMDWATGAAKTKENKGGVITAGTSLQLTNFESGKYEVELFPPLTSQYTQDRKLRRYNSVSMNGGTITNKCTDEEVKIILRWLDINYSEEDVLPGLDRLSSWLGIEGETWRLTSDGKNEYFEMLTPANITMSSYEWILKYAAPGPSPAAVVTTAIPANNPSQEMKATQSLENLYPYMRDPFPDGFLKYSSADQEKLANRLTDITTYVNQMKAKFITGTEPLSKWSEYVSQVEKMGIGEVLAIKQAAYDALMSD